MLEYARAASAGAYLAATILTIVRPSWLRVRTSLSGVALMLIGFGVFRTVPDFATYGALFAVIGAIVTIVRVRDAMQAALVVPFATAIALLAAAVVLPLASSNTLRDASAVLFALPIVLIAIVAIAREIAVVTSQRSQT